MHNIFELKNWFEEHRDVQSHLKYGDYSRCKSPLISVVMPVYKRPDMLEIALKTVLNQKDNDVSYEVVVVDNNEEKESPNQIVVETINNDRIFYYRHDKNLGMYGNFNRGIELARGKYITFCHDDDTFVDTTLKTLYSIKKKVGKECIIGEKNKIDINGVIIETPNFPSNFLFLKLKEYVRYSMFDVMVKCPGIGGGGSLFDKECLVELGGFDESLYPGSDYALIINIMKRYGVVQTPISTYNYRIACNASFDIGDTYADINKKFHEYMRSYIKLPDYLINIIINSLYKESKIADGIWQGKKEKITSHNYINKLIMLSCRAVVKRKFYSFS